MKCYSAPRINENCASSRMQITAAVMVALISSYIAAVSSNERYTLMAFAIIGGILGGFVGMYVYGEITAKERGLRWAVNIATSMILGIPFSRLFCYLFHIDLEPDIACFGGGVMGVFGVGLLILVKKSLPSIINLILRIKGVKFQLQEKDKSNEDENEK